MSSSRRRDLGLVVALTLSAGCGRTPSSPRDTDQDRPPMGATAPPDAAPPIDSQPLDAPMPNPTPTISAEDQRALDRAIGDLDDEHRQGWGPAMAWLVAHPALSRPSLVELVEGDDGNAADMAVTRAATCLGEIGHPDDVPVLVRAHQRGTEVSRWDFAQALATHRDPAALQALIVATGADDPEVARTAAAGLGWRKDEAARPVLEALLDHGSEKVRYQAVLALVELGAGKSRNALKQRKKVEQDADVRGALRKALAK